MHTVFILGDSLFAETLAQMLAETGAVKVLGTAPTPETAGPLLATERPDAIIIAGIGQAASVACSQLLVAYPDLPMIRADLNMEGLQIITSYRTGNRTADLLAAIDQLPRRRQL